MVQDQVLVRLDNTPAIYTPNVFSPNKDGNNDRFTIFAKEGHVKSVLEFRIYDRWGNKVFETLNIQPNTPEDGWDGNFMDKELNPAVYVYYAILELTDGRLYHLYGDVTLIR